MQIDYDRWDAAPLEARRGLSAETCRKFGYGYVETQQGWRPAATYYRQGKPAAQKVLLRREGKKKQYTFLGETQGLDLFGQQLWAGGRSITLTEGEVDCLSAFEANGRSYPVASLRNGASAAVKDLEPHLEWLESFDKVIIMFDMDEPGRAAAQQVAALLSPGKAFIAELPENDVNEVLTKRGPKAVQDSYWNARPWRPDGIVSGEAIWDHVEKPLPRGLKLPHSGLQQMLRGIRSSELWLFGAGSGAGKSSFCRELAVHYAKEHGLRVGYVALEETVQRAAVGVLSVLAQERLHLEEEIDAAELKDEWGSWLDEHFVFYDHFGSVEGTQLLSKIRYMAVVEKAQVIILDHISIAISGLEVTDERKALDVLMTKLRSLVQETGVTMLVVSHLKRAAGKSFEQGAEINMSDFRGSAGLEQMSDVIIGQERNLQAEEEDERDYTRLRVLKNRPVGETGVAGWLKFDRETGRLLESDGPGGTEPSADPINFLAEGVPF